MEFMDRVTLEGEEGWEGLEFWDHMVKLAERGMLLGCRTLETVPQKYQVQIMRIQDKLMKGFSDKTEDRNSQEQKRAMMKLLMMAAICLRSPGTKEKLDRPKILNDYENDVNLLEHWRSKLKAHPPHERFVVETRKPGEQAPLAERERQVHSELRKGDLGKAARKLTAVPLGSFDNEATREQVKEKFKVDTSSEAKITDYLEPNKNDGVQRLKVTMKHISTAMDNMQKHKGQGPHGNRMDFFLYAFKGDTQQIKHRGGLQKNIVMVHEQRLERRPFVGFTQTNIYVSVIHSHNKTEWTSKTHGLHSGVDENVP